MNHDPNCPLCIAGDHAAGHPPPEEPDPPISAMAWLMLAIVVLAIVAGWLFLMWLLVTATG